MAHRQTEMIRVVRRALEQTGAHVTSVGSTKGNHGVIEFTVGTQHRKIFFASTPSDQRAYLNSRSQAISMVKQMKEQTS